MDIIKITPMKEEAEVMAARRIVLVREIGMLRQIQRGLKADGIQARLNFPRIAVRVAELETIESFLEIIARFGAEEIDRCERLEN
jgi:hypothetical protein